MFSKIVYVLSLVFFISIIYKNYHLLDSIPADLMKAKLLLLLLAAVLQILKYLVLAYNFYINFQKAGVRFTYKEVLKATFVYMYVSVSTPFIGAGGLLAFVDYAGHKEFNKIKTAAGAFLALLADYLGFFLIILFSLLFFRDSIDDFPVNYLYAMLGFGGLLLTLVFLSIFTKDFLVKFLHQIQRILNFISHKIHKKVHLDEEWAHRNVHLAHECFVDIKHDPKFYIKPVLIGLLFHILNIVSLAVVAWSFKEVIPVSKVVSSYVVLNTLETVSPTPNGIGIIEVFVPEFMRTIGIDFGNSLIIITIFRLIYFYIPLLVGFYFSHKIFLKREK
jgi:uncharacterized protein (TIRG00374 family)